MGGLLAAVVYFLLPDTERVASASSAVLHFAAAVAVVAGLRAHRPANPRPWYLIATALLAIGTGDSRVSLAGRTMEVGSLPGHGTTVEVRLPITATPAAVAHTP